MKLWLLERTSYKDKPRYDVQRAVVIRAETEAAAREDATKTAGDEGEAVWLDPSKSTCEELTADGPPGLVIQDFNAG